MLHFDCDYMEGTHPEVMRRLLETNLEQTPGYGCDPHTERARELIRQACGAPQAEVHFLVGGTQTNATVIDGLLRRHEGVLAAESGHINVHEAGAIEAAGHKVLTLPSHEGKVRAEEVDRWIEEFYRDETWPHMVAPGMLYLSHPTEFGTLYTLSEMEAIHAVCQRYSIPLYLDGARLGYALASEENTLTLRDIARLCEVFYIGGTKTGLLFGEAVVITRPELLPHFFTLVKQHGALLAKGRLLGVQFETLFTEELYLRIARQAISTARRLKEALLAKGYRLHIDSPTNQQFFVLPNREIDRLSQYATFELWGPRGKEESVVRFVTSWATTDEQIDALIARL
ncbi:low specificity L-threonine aldolase [Alistipes sp. An116]|uniref:threonine aldolase family protein n=1 Tax=Alistipes sp. An116 TaxID=1965546 RepID=UPI000B37A1CC|nr:beta-eliminating lyase-related protein [Alistipes sp. An116]OUQ54400.1 low specificity L-threonine aldolase [Alistipes sp. An116]